MSFTIAIVVFFVGAGVNRAIKPLQSWNIPEAVTGGLIAAAATLAAYVVVRVEVNFSLDARDMLLLYFFTGIGLNAKLDDLISGGRPFLILLALTLVYFALQNLIAAGSVAALGLPQGIGAAARLHRADRRPRHHHRLGADHRRAVRPQQRPRSRHRHGDARQGGREPRRRSDRRIPHPPPRARRPQRRRTRWSASPTIRSTDTLTTSTTIASAHPAHSQCGDPDRLRMHEIVNESPIKLPLFVVCLLVGIVVTNTVPRALPAIQWPTRSRAV